MGCGVSRTNASKILSGTRSSRDDSVDLRTQWNYLCKSATSRKKFVLDGSIPREASDSMYELRFYLDDGELLNTLANFAAGLGLQYSKVLVCWINVQSFKAAGVDYIDMQRCTAVHICEFYINTGGAQPLEGIIDVEEFSGIQQMVADSDDILPLPVDLFNQLLLKCFIYIHDEVWKDFRKSSVYETSIAAMKTYKTVDPDDFIFLEKLGEGSFGVVVHAQKKSTGRSYGMKVITKSCLIETHAANLERVTIERTAMIKCSHPFIIGLDFAFQTSDVVVMAMELGKCGTLHDALSSCTGRRMPEERVRFYAAEMVLGLSHMHRLGLVYRDLKPGNVLLMADGHIKLLDLGGVVDPHELVLSPDTTTGVPPSSYKFWKEFSSISTDEPQNVHTSARMAPLSRQGSEAFPSVRARSVVGTLGYMAPEVLGMCYAEYKGYATGYSKSADYWSLGMTMIVLLTGRNPFNSDSLDYFLRFLQDEPPLVYKLFISNMKQQFDAETFNLVSQLITIDGSTRLGSGRAGLSKLKSEEYFSEIDWNKLVRKAIKPPFVPDVMAFSHREFKSFTDMKQKLLKKVKNDKQITKEQNAYFEKWDYVSGKAVMLEIGMLSSRG